MLWARLRPSNIDASEGAVEELERFIGQIRSDWPGAKIIVCGDSGFCRDSIMAWCEAHSVDCVFRLAINGRLKAMIAKELQ
jgi:hypothetical protein